MWEGKQPHKYKAWFINTTFTELDHVDTFFNEFFKTEGLIKEYLDTGLMLIREFNQVLQIFFQWYILNRNLFKRLFFFNFYRADVPITIHPKIWDVLPTVRHVVEVLNVNTDLCVMPANPWSPKPSHRSPVLQTLYANAILFYQYSVVLFSFPWE